ncbi:ATP-binding protein [Fusobacterium canifelinum]|uniref:ATP-binding protein n=1 Tax=Fusobacterium canifelinum TaxID=285729 RepID=A0A7T4FQ43_9FUSO|nr:AAA family ATPase [Fusobacterium canifelinum]QQB74655.1 ATP-binding protein [Fusobacterium canifelinum]
MDIELKNIALIEEGNLELKGITLIADENDSGKSTIGKTLFTTLTTLNNFEREFLSNFKHRIVPINSVIDDILHGNLITSESLLEKIDNFSKELDNFDNSINEIIKNSIELDINEKIFENLKKLLSDLIKSSDILKKNLRKYIEQKDTEEKNLNLVYDIPFLIEELDDLITLSSILNYEKIKLSSFQRAFNREFESSIKNIFLDKKESSIKLNEKSEVIQINIEDNKISNVDFIYGKIKREINAIYIESPLILDYIEEISKILLKFNNKINQNYRAKILKDTLQNEKKIDIVDTVLGKEELYKDLLEKIHKIILGEFEYSQNNKDFIYKKEGYVFNKKNVATGIKSFGIIEILLKNKQLDENTILIIDEPEVHLHPKWQIKYAEILILISKELGVKILLNSHSPYLIRAMEVYRKNYDYEENIKFYTLTDCTEGKSKKIVDVTNNLNQIFDKLIEPYEILREVDERYSDDE